MWIFPFPLALCHSLALVWLCLEARLLEAAILHLSWLAGYFAAWKDAVVMLEFCPAHDFHQSVVMECFFGRAGVNSGSGLPEIGFWNLLSR
jgi:hypothetical protein